MEVARRLALHCYLDYGSGIGSGAILFASNGFDVTLADISEPMLRFACWRLEKRNLPYRAIHLRSESLADGVWEIITMLDVPEHVADPLELMSALRPHIDPRGLLVVRAPFDDERPQHIPHDMRTPSRFPGLGFRFAWEHMGRNGLPIVVQPRDRGGLGNGIVDLIDNRILGVATGAVGGLRALRLRILGKARPTSGD